MSDEARCLVDFLSSGGRVGVIVGSDSAGASALLRETAAAFMGPVFKVADPFITPTGLARITRDADAHVAADVGLSPRTIADGATPGPPAMLAIEDAHKLDGAALTTLADLASRARDEPRIVLLLAGNEALDERLAGLGLEPLRDFEHVLKLILQDPDDDDLFGEERYPPVGPASPLPRLPLPAPAQGQPKAGRRRWQTPLLLVVVLAAAGIGIGAVLRGQPPPALPAVEQAASGAAAPPVPAAAQPPTLVTPDPATSASNTPGPEDELRARFRAFLERSGRANIANNPATFDSLFRDYLRWRARDHAEPEPRPPD